MNESNFGMLLKTMQSFLLTASGNSSFLNVLRNSSGTKDLLPKHVVLLRLFENLDIVNVPSFFGQQEANGIWRK